MHGRIGRVVAVLAAGALVTAVIASAGESYKISASLNAKQEIPKQAVKVADATGAFSGTYVEKGKSATLTWKLTFSYLSGAATAAHIHLGKQGVAGDVLVPLCAPCKSGQTGKAKVSAAVVKDIKSGKTYVNVHTAKNPAGEIRGQVKLSG